MFRLWEVGHGENTNSAQKAQPADLNPEPSCCMAISKYLIPHKAPDIDAT